MNKRKGQKDSMHAWNAQLSMISAYVLGNEIQGNFKVKYPHHHRVLNYPCCDGLTSGSGGLN